MQLQVVASAGSVALAVPPRLPAVYKLLMAKSATEKAVPDPAAPGYAGAMQHQCTLLHAG